MTPDPTPQKQGCCDKCDNDQQAVHIDVAVPYCINKDCECHRPYSEIEKEVEEAIKSGRVCHTVEEVLNVPDDEIETLIASREHTALALELPAEVYDHYTKWLRSALERIRTTAREEQSEELADELTKQQDIWLKEGREAEQKRILEAYLPWDGTHLTDTAKLEKLKAIITNRDHE